MANEKTYPNYLMHYRTKGSKNGISTTKGYTAIGQKARGHYVNGHYVYYEDDAKQRAFRQGLAESRGRNSAYENQAMVKRMENSRKADVLDQKIYGKKIKGYTRLADISPYEKQRLADKYLSNSPQHQAAVNQHNANISGMNAAYEYAQKQKSKRQTNIGASQAADAARNQSVMRNNIKSGKTKAGNMTMDGVDFTVSGKGKTIAARDDAARSHQNAVSQAAAERKAREAALKQQKKASTKNAINTSPYTGDPRYTRQMQDIRNRAGKYITSVGTYDKPKLAKSIALEKATHNAAIESSKRNSRSDIGNAFADLKEDAKNTFKELKSKFKKKKK